MMPRVPPPRLPRPPRPPSLPRPPRPPRLPRLPRPPWLPKLPWPQQTTTKRYPRTTTTRAPRTTTTRIPRTTTKRTRRTTTTRTTTTNTPSTTTMRPTTPKPCKPTVTKVRGGAIVCGGQTIFEDTFDSFRDKMWQIEHYIPSNSPVRLSDLLIFPITKFWPGLFVITSYYFSLHNQSIEIYRNSRSCRTKICPLIQQWWWKMGIWESLPNCRRNSQGSLTTPYLQDLSIYFKGKLNSSSYYWIVCSKRLQFFR